MTAGRRSYSRLSQLPAWLLLSIDGAVVASVRADSAETARLLFRTGLALADVRRGVRIRRGDGDSPPIPRPEADDG